MTNNKDITELDKEVAHSIRDLVTRLNRRFRKQISNPDQLSVAELNVIQLLLYNEQLPSEICAQLGLSSQYVSQVLNKLEELAYIGRKASSTDKRKSRKRVANGWLTAAKKEKNGLPWQSLANILRRISPS